MRHCTSFCGCLAFIHVNHYTHGKTQFFNLHCCKGSRDLLINFKIDLQRVHYKFEQTATLNFNLNKGSLRRSFSRKYSTRLTFCI